MFAIYKTAHKEISKVNSMKDENLWINLVNPTEEELLQVCEGFQIDMDLLRAALDYEERPRIETEDGQVLLLISMPNKPTNEASVLYNTIPLGIVVTEKVIVTIALEESLLIDQLLLKKNAPTTQKRTRFVLQMLYSNAQLFLNCLREIDKKSNQIEQHLHKSSKNKELINLLNLEKSLVYFTTALRANESVSEKLLRTYLRKTHDEESEITVKVLKSYDEDEDLLEDVIIENKQAIDMAYIYTNILSGTMDAFASIISNNLNIVMKFLAIITIGMAIPTIITSFFGMNVPIPYQNSAFAYLYIISISIFLMIVVILFITKKKMY